MRGFLLFSSASLLASCAVLPQAPTADAPAQFVADRVPIIEARIQGSKALNFIVDTGASDELVDAGLAASLRLDLADSALVRQPGGEVAMRKTPGADVIAAGRRLASWPLTAAPLSPLSPLVGRRIDGLFGRRLFEKYVVEFDYARRRVRLIDPERFRYRGPGAVVPLERPDGRLFVRATITGENGVEATGLLQLDTGSFEVVGLEGPDVVRAGLVGENDPHAELFGAAIGGSTSGFRTRLRKIAIGPIVVDRPVASVTTSDNAGDDPAAMGVLGGGALRSFRLFVDVPRNRIILEPTGTVDGAGDHWDAAGVVIVSPEPFNRVLIQAVLRDSPASRAGLMAGDEVLAIDGLPVSELRFDGVGRMFGAPRRVYRLRILRDGHELGVSLATAPLI